jgi:hypothetical protein
MRAPRVWIVGLFLCSLGILSSPEAWGQGKARIAAAALKRNVSRVATYPFRNALLKWALVETKKGLTPGARHILNDPNPDPSKVSPRDIVSLVVGWDPADNIGRALQRAREESVTLFTEKGARFPEDLDLKITRMDLAGNWIMRGRSPSTGARVMIKVSEANFSDVLERELVLPGQRLLVPR